MTFGLYYNLLLTYVSQFIALNDTVSQYDVFQCKLHEDARGSGLISFDGRHRQDFTKDHV